MKRLHNSLFFLSDERRFAAVPASLTFWRCVPIFTNRRHPHLVRPPEPGNCTAL
jgi:hypothetical protein